MKKWFILALVAAVFMVTFPACGGDDDGGISEAGNVVMSLSQDKAYIIVTWNGDEVGYRYDVVFADVEGEGGGLFSTTGPDYVYAPGQNVVIFSLNDAGDVVALGNKTPGKWSAKIDVTTVLDTHITSKKALVGVVALSPGGYSFGSKVVWGHTPEGAEFVDWTP